MLRYRPASLRNGVVVALVALAILTGFHEELQSRILGAASHLNIYRGGGQGFVDVAEFTGVNAPFFEFAERDHVIQGVMGSQLGDVNLDGIPDVFVGNGGAAAGERDNLLVSTGLVAWTSPCGLRGSTRHLRLPSFQPELITLATVGSANTDCTPGTPEMRQLNSSIASIVSKSMQPSGGVSANTVMTSTPIENFSVMARVSRL